MVLHRALLVPYQDDQQYKAVLAVLAKSTRSNILHLIESEIILTAKEQSPLQGHHITITMNVTMPCSVNAVPCLIITTLTLLGSASAQTTRTFTDFSFTTLTTLGYTLTQLLEPTTLSYTPYTLATPLVCPEGYGMLHAHTSNTNIFVDISL